MDERGDPESADADGLPPRDGIAGEREMAATSRKWRRWLPPRAVAAGMGVLVVAAILLYAVHAANSEAQAPLPVSRVATQTAAASHVLYQAPLTPNSPNAQYWANDSRCHLDTDGLHVTDALCYVPLEEVSNIEVSVDVRQTSGSILALYGIDVRRAAVGNYYSFVIDSNDKAAVFKCDTFANATTPECSRMKGYTQYGAINGGLNTMNALDVRAVGSHFVFSINGSSVVQVDDSSFASGLVGLEAAQGINVVFSSLKITDAA